MHQLLRQVIIFYFLPQANYREFRWDDGSNCVGGMHVIAWLAFINEKESFEEKPERKTKREVSN